MSNENKPDFSENQNNHTGRPDHTSRLNHTNPAGHLDDPRLTACALGELAPDERAAFEAAIRDDAAAQTALAEIRALAEHCITTLGEKGSRLETGGRAIHIPSLPVAVKDPTGAGDAYRAGLLHGLANGLPLEACAKLGATAASFCVERMGTQEHSFDKTEFDARHAAHFG
jgi:sugar/nucleoside kinase (ribokinase family)